MRLKTLFASKRLSILLLALVTGCSTPVDHKPMTTATYEQNIKSDLDSFRFWADQRPKDFEKGLTVQAKILRKRFPSAIGATSESAPRSAMLAISGGGANGAFAAGLLKGWSESGKRVPFEVVTGVSTGALIAPFAFLGPEYDAVLFDIYSSSGREQIFEWDVVSGLLGGSGITDTKPLRAYIQKHITQEMIDAIAEQSRLGRALFIITTNFDANRAVVWNIGAIARLHGAAAAPLIHKVMLASASVPVVAPPVPIAVEIAGKTYTELHVDGGLSHQVFAYPSQISIADIERLTGLKFNNEIYLIRNSNAQTGYSPAPTDLVSIAARTINSLLDNQGSSGVEQIYYLTRRDGIKFHTIEIPPKFQANGSHEFDLVYMRELLTLGRDIGRTGDFWYDKPPTLR